MAVTHGNGVRAGAPPPLTGVIRDVPADCQRIIIVGAGGFGREVLQWATDAWPEHRGRIAGFLASGAHPAEGSSLPLGILESPEKFGPSEGDYLLLGIGIPGARRRVAEDLLSRGARFLSLVHPTAIVAPTATIGVGAVLCPYVVVSDSAGVGEFVLMNYHSSLAHDAHAGAFSVLSPYATLGGCASVRDDVFLGLHAAVCPNVVLGAGTRVSAGAVAMRNAEAGSLVFGVPGRSTKHLQVN